jgi:hypothetical protein
MCSAIEIPNTKGAYDDLTLMAQLNMDADHAAEQFMNAYGASRPYVPCFPHNRAQLHLPEGTSTYRNKSQIRYAASAPELKAYYIQQINDWSDSTMSHINWTAHGRAINHRIIPRSHCCKLIHDILSTNSIVSQYDDHRTAYCPQCQSIDEDWDHILRCPHSDRMKWRTSFLINLRKRCETLKTRPYLQDILISGDYAENKNPLAGVKSSTVD